MSIYWKRVRERFGEQFNGLHMIRRGDARLFEARIWNSNYLKNMVRLATEAARAQAIGIMATPIIAPLYYPDQCSLDASSVAIAGIIRAIVAHRHYFAIFQTMMKRRRPHVAVRQSSNDCLSFYSDGAASDLGSLSMSCSPFLHAIVNRPEQSYLSLGRAG